MSNQPASLVSINGLWMSALSWQNSVKYHTENGCRVMARCWPGMEIDVEVIRRDPSPMARREPREFVSRAPVSTAGASAF
jgi:hypothetical protein